MKRLLKLFVPTLLATTLYAGNASAWEAATTHAGLTEQSALSSSLHKRLQAQFGSTQGLFAMLAIPKEDAPALFEIMQLLNPTHGYVPDASGRMTALSWLVLGSVVADMPASHAAFHFLEPQTGKGITNRSAQGPIDRLYLTLLGASAQAGLKTDGQTVKDWWDSADNPLGYPGFMMQFRHAVTAQSQAERSRHLAGSLVSTGAMLHLLQDMGVPSRVRDDISAHQQQIGPHETDRGSRLERIAAMAFGRLGIPKPSKASALPPHRTSLADHLTNQSQTGLADVIASQYFSYGTLPKTFKTKRDTGSSAFRSAIDANLRRPSPSSSSPKGSPSFDLIAARNKEGASWRSDDGVCLARYHVKQAKVYWSLDDDCALEQLEAILPKVASYGVSFLETLFPDDLGFQSDGGRIHLVLGPKHYGHGKLRFFSDAPDGTRSEFHSVDITTALATVALPQVPAGSTRITALFDGKDTHGALLLATTSSVLPLP